MVKFEEIESSVASLAEIDRIKLVTNILSSLPSILSVDNGIEEALRRDKEMDDGQYLTENEFFEGIKNARG